MVTRTLTDVRNGTCNTTDNTTHVPLITFDTSVGAPGGLQLNNCTIFVNAQCAGYNTTNNKSSAESIAAVFKVVSGTLSKVATTTTVVNTIDDTTGTQGFDFSVSGTVITVYVIGVAAAMTWFGTANFLIYQPV